MATLSRRWRPYKGKVDRDLLLQQFGSIGVLDGGFRFLESGVFDENVALKRACISDMAFPR